jgi:hypothetical protein
MAFIIVIVLVISGVALVAFMVLVAGVRGTDRRMRLRSRSTSGPADAFARKVLGVYVRQPETSVSQETESACHDRVGR